MERAILVGIKLGKGKHKESENSLSELVRLAETAGAVPEHIIVQNKVRLDPAYLIGKGKALEIKEIADADRIRTVIFDEDLKPVQQKNLEELMKLKIIGRTRLILDIFAHRAHTKEGILQVELAQMNYLLPRITEKFGRFEQQVGGIGTRGPGERKLEVDKRRVRDRIAFLKKQTENIRFHRQVLRSQRIESGYPTVSIVGYTNAGKSTLLNSLSSKHAVYADDKFFATLDPTTRQVTLPGGRTVLFTDTVGFIRKLPHTLVAAFRATLEEISASSCILHLIDVSQPDYLDQIQTTLGVLKELSAEKIPVISVYNKSDLIPAQQRKRLTKEGCILVSAKSGAGINKLLGRVKSIIIPRITPHKLTLPYDKSKHISKVHKLAVIKKQDYTDKGILLHLRCTPERWQKIKAVVSR